MKDDDLLGMTLGALVDCIKWLEAAKAEKWPSPKRLLRDLPDGRIAKSVARRDPSDGSYYAKIHFLDANKGLEGEHRLINLEYLLVIRLAGIARSRFHVRPPDGHFGLRYLIGYGTNNFMRLISGAGPKQIVQRIADRHNFRRRNLRLMRRHPAATQANKSLDRERLIAELLTAFQRETRIKRLPFGVKSYEQLLRGAFGRLDRWPLEDA